MSKPGHNSKVKAGPVNAERLKSLVERIERLEEERKAIGSDVKDVYAEAKGVGYDVKTMRQIVKERAQDTADRDEQEALLEVYRHALGMGTYRSVAAQYGISKSKLHRLVPREENGTSAPQPQDGDDGITGGEHVKAEADDDAARGVGSREDQGQQQRESRLADGRSVQHEEARDGADASGGTQRLQHGVRSPAEAADPVRLTTATPFLGDDPGPPPPFLRGSQTGRGA